MRMFGWLPWVREHRQLTTEREEAEERAAHVTRHLVEPLRAMRTYDALTQAVQVEMLRQIRRPGNPGPEAGED